MCIILYKPEGAELPSKTRLQRCFNKNRHGAGLAVKRNFGWRCRKGFMDWVDFWSAYRNELLTEKDEFALHFRWATSGGTSKGNCHPFPLSGVDKELQRLKFNTHRFVMHNGVLGQGEHNLSDTMIFIKEQLVWLQDDLEVEGVLDYIKTETNGSKLLIMDGDKVYRTGGWEKDKGVYYSNDGFKARVYPKSTYSGARSTETKNTNAWKWWHKNQEKTNWRNIDRDYECPACQTKGGLFRKSYFVDEVTCLRCGCVFTEGGVMLKEHWNMCIWEKFLKETPEDFAEEVEKVDLTECVCAVCGCDAYKYISEVFTPSDKDNYYYCRLCRQVVDLKHKENAVKSLDGYYCNSCGKGASDYLLESYNFRENKPEYWCMNCQKFVELSEIKLVPVEEEEAVCLKCGATSASGDYVVQYGSGDYGLRYWCLSCDCYV